MIRRHFILASTLASLGLSLAPAQAQTSGVTIGVTLSTTGPAASLGIAEKNTIELLPKTLGGLPVNYIVLDDASDPTQAAKNARRFVDADRADAIIGTSNVPGSLAVAEVANETRTPQIALAPFAPKQIPWVFPLPQSVEVMSTALFEHMKSTGVKTLGFVGFSDAYGEAWLQEVQKTAPRFGVDVVVVERFARTDQSVTAQTLKVIQAKPDAVLVAGSGTPSALPMRALRERGYKGQFYQTHGVANNDFLRVAGSADEGAILPTGNVLVVEQLPDGNPSKKVGLAYVRAYESKYGTGSRSPFGAYAHDAYLVLDRAVAVAAAKAKPGSPEFRAALRDALETTRDLATTHGVVTMSATDHSGFGATSRVLVTIEKNTWKLLK
ncbi:ABC transporter substrate-binding protein [Piscinibacter gummiphilus]|uniref:Branched-chain amino acid ABC transporter substrate-binding protein n=1 Tax=Piscinibacter gummiphilus TaxID=946333 RepID=A0A1W6L623_9BURK|nr:ABC transporter substrate-binding protein [Piscinibacter gummiphilus]ARN19630.1 branched-chain amino acid ABC transporter substrate-binding protein [Piscinibacter gummiphilus]ATU64300.1 branched-chain amino acid ABC transporter substrate-binding protein [Piscinibacter gummiphilus]GLS93499.1 branched-chain amino acid ABC transporter substrate-binding protein [Piscinibacter gummiphilus]